MCQTACKKDGVTESLDGRTFPNTNTLQPFLAAPPSFYNPPIHSLNLYIWVFKFFAPSVSGVQNDFLHHSSACLSTTLC